MEFKPVGAGYWSQKVNGIYTKLVKRDKSPLLDRLKISLLNLKPQRGHNPRRQAILDKRKQKETK